MLPQFMQRLLTVHNRDLRKGILLNVSVLIAASFVLIGVFTLYSPIGES